MLFQRARCFKGRVVGWLLAKPCPVGRCGYTVVHGKNGRLQQRVVRTFYSPADGGQVFPEPQREQQQHDKTRYGTRLKQQWTVPRTNVNHYPEETRKIIQQKQHATTLTNGQSIDGGRWDVVLVESLDMCRAALEYERHMNYVDFVGRSGERFSSWMSMHLKEFEDFVSAHPRVFNVDDFKSLVAVLHADYLGLDSKTKRKRVVEDCESMLTAIHTYLEDIAKQNQLKEIPKNKRASERNQGFQSEQTVPRVSTADFRNSFMQRAMETQHRKREDAQSGVNELQGEQRTELWKALRSSRLTASAFSKALGFFSGDRVSLWEEKIGVREPFKGNDATRWGTVNETKALVTYEKLTGQKVESCMFKVKKDDVVHDWLGASPDGLVAGLGLLQEQPSDPSALDPMLGPKTMGPGILEVKCPYNKGHPDLAEPPKKAIWYYMPQIQGLMDVFDREWCILYVWTPNNGSSSFIISRDRQYWATCFDVLAEFWWSHTVPARQIRSLHDVNGSDMDDSSNLWLQYRPSEFHPKSEMLKEWSKKIAWSSPGRVFPHVEI